MRQRLLLAAFLCLAAAVRAAAAVPIVDNPAEPPGGTVTVTLQEVWRAGGDDEDVLLGVPTAAARGADGTVYVSDRQLATVHVFSPDGTFLRDIGREGEGPGELRRPGDVVLLPGDVVGVVQRFPGRVVLLHPDGTPAGSLPLGDDAAAGGFHALHLLHYRDGRLLCREAHMTRDGDTFRRELVVVLRDSTGGEIARLYTHAQVNQLSRPHFVERDGYQPPAALGPGGTVYLAPDREAYRIQVYDRDGRLLRVITRAYRPRRRTAEEKERAGRNMRVFRNGRDVKVEREVCDTDQALLRLHVAGDGTLWVLSSRGTHDQPDGVLQTWDLFDPAGRYLRRVALAGPVDPEQDRLLFLDGDHWLLLRNVQDALRALRGEETETEDEEAEPVELVLLQSG